ncbi:hypothetical protein L1887_51706 [Cichorium endivia]|nr:hypothetical protein L1887_51706 [Cichorium endivia]
MPAPVSAKSRCKCIELTYSRSSSHMPLCASLGRFRPPPPLLFLARACQANPEPLFFGETQVQAFRSIRHGAKFASLAKVADAKCQSHAERGRPRSSSDTAAKQRPISAARDADRQQPTKKSQPLHAGQRDEQQPAATSQPGVPDPATNDDLRVLPAAAVGVGEAQIQSSGSRWAGVWGWCWTMHACMSVQRNATRSDADQDVGAGRVGYGVQAVDLASDSGERTVCARPHHVAAGESRALTSLDAVPFLGAGPCQNCRSFIVARRPPNYAPLLAAPSFDSVAEPDSSRPRSPPSSTL